MGAVLRQQMRDRFTNATAGAGHQGYLSGQIEAVMRHEAVSWLLSDGGTGATKGMALA
jgi:hypothetical protein